MCLTSMYYSGFIHRSTCPYAAATHHVSSSTRSRYVYRMQLPTHWPGTTQLLSYHKGCAGKKVQALQSRGLDSSKTLKQIMNDHHSALKDAFLEMLSSKEYHCQQIGLNCRQRLSRSALEKYSASQVVKINAEKQAGADYLRDARLTALHTLVNITKHPFQPGTLEVSYVDQAHLLPNVTLMDILQTLRTEHAELDGPLRSGNRS